jgi:penicillin-binding protein 2
LASTTTEHRPLRRLGRAPERPPAAEQPYRVTQRLVVRVGVLSVLVLVVFAALLLRLWALQVLTGTKYVDQAAANSYRTVRVQAPRGPILDRNGRVLVLNAPATAVKLWPADLPKVYTVRYAELRRLAHVTGVPLYEIARGIKARTLANDPLTPVIVRDAASGPMVTYLSEHADAFPGVDVLERTYIRHYPYHSLAAQVLGYVGEISQPELKSKANLGYQLGDEIGQGGVEASYDRYLRGVAGTQRRHVDSANHPRGSVITTALPKPGHALRLTLDLKLQQAAEKALRYGISLAQSNGQWAARGGAIVALDPQDGSILALASSPSYEPSVFAGRVSEKALGEQGLTGKTAELKNFPSFNRALMGTYPPGSVFKPVTALAAMQAHMVSPYAYLPCTGSYASKFDKAKNPHQFHNWDPNVNQQMDMPTALAYSCDTYFYQLGDLFYGLPSDRGQPLQKWAEAFGFGRITGSDVGPEASGLVPTIGWRLRSYTQKTDPLGWQVDSLWKPGDSIQLAIGQKDLLVTPMQMARFYALIANGGKLVTPHILMDVENANGTPVPVAAPPGPKDVGVDPGALQVVRQGLLEGTHLSFGTSYGVFGKFPVSIAGKTGTAEKVVTLPGYRGLQNQSWWCGYGPADAAAKIVVCAVIENGGHGGTAAAPAAMQVFAKFFNVQAKQAAPIHSD